MDIQEILDQAKAHGIEAVTAAVDELKRRGQQSRQEAKAACQAYFTDVEEKGAKVKRRLANLARQEAEIKAKINAMQPGLVSATVAGDSEAFDRIQNDLAGMEAQRAAVATQIQLLSGAPLHGDLKLYEAAEAQCGVSGEASQRYQTELEDIKAFVREQAKAWDRLSDDLRYVTFYTPGAADADMVKVYEHFKNHRPAGRPS